MYLFVLEVRWNRPRYCQKLKGARGFENAAVIQITYNHSKNTAKIWLKWNKMTRNKAAIVCGGCLRLAATRALRHQPF